MVWYWFAGRLAQGRYGLDAEELGDPDPPLDRERLPVHQDEIGDLMHGEFNASVPAHWLLSASLALGRAMHRGLLRLLGTG